jgi:hypothetical protein
VGPSDQQTMTGAQLIAALENAPGPSVALDQEIARHFGKSAHYTCSFDAATSLLPDTLQWGIWRTPMGSGAAHFGFLMGYGATPILAVCVVAVRERYGIADSGTSIHGQRFIESFESRCPREDG